MNLNMTTISAQEELKDENIRSTGAVAYAQAARVAVGVCGNDFAQTIALKGSGTPSLSLSLHRYGLLFLLVVYLW
jgi:hypothetical protein